MQTPITRNADITRCAPGGVRVEDHAAVQDVQFARVHKVMVVEEKVGGSRLGDVHAIGDHQAIRRGQAISRDLQPRAIAIERREIGARSARGGTYAHQAVNALRGAHEVAVGSIDILL